MAGDKIRVNQNIVSWGSIRVKLDGEVFTGFDMLGYGDKRERVKAYGMGRHHAPRARSRGKYSTDPVKLRGPKSTVQLLRERLASKSADGISYGDVEFDIVASYVEQDDFPMLVEISDCVITAQTSNEEENPDPLKEEIEIDCMSIRRNGLTLFDSSTGTPV